MYSQVNHAPQFQQGPLTQPPHVQQGPPPHPPFHQGPPGPPPPHVIHQGPSAVLPHVVNPVPPSLIYQHGPPAPPPPVQQSGPPPPPQSIQVPAPLMVNTGQPYLHPPPSVHGISPMTLSYPTAQHNAQYPSPSPHTRAPLAGPAHPEIIRVPLPPRVLPPPLLQGQMLYRIPLHPPPPGIGQSLRPGRPLPPPPPPSSFVPVTPAPCASFVHSPFEDAYPPSMPPPPPPPPPSSPPPLPPSPPPLPSSPNLFARSSAMSFVMPVDVASGMSHHLESDSGTDKLSDSVKRVILSVDKVVGPARTIDDFPVSNDYPDGGGTSCDIDSMGEDGLSSKRQVLLNLPSPPVKPSEEEIVRQIEVLCQFIAKNGPEFEDMIREKECGNPKFAFLFSGAPGSEAAIANEYFQWMKRKFHVKSKLYNVSEQNDSSVRPSEIESSIYLNSFLNKDASHSPAESDMDMEDDINQYDKDLGLGNVIEDSREPVSMHGEVLILKEELHEPQCSRGCSITRDALSRIISCSEALMLTEGEREHDQSMFGRPFAKDHSPVMSSAGVAECTLDDSIKKFSRPVIEDLSPNPASRTAVSNNYMEVPGPLIKGGSPFRLIREYASDDSAAEDNDGPSLEDVSPVRVSRSVTVGNTGSHDDVGINLDTNVDSKNVSVTEKGFMSLTESSLVCTSMPDISPKSYEAVEATVIIYDPLDAIAKTDEHQNDNREDQPFNGLECKDALQGDVDIDPQSGKFQKEDAKQNSAVLKVDEFGRLVREGASDSDSDGTRYTGRRARRGRSRSRSCSPRRRKEKQNRSCSRSPKKRRGRSKSPPAFRHMGEFGGKKMKRDRVQIPECIDFLRGRCYRGSSCRFVHHGSATGDAARHHKSRQKQYLESPQDMRSSVMRGDSYLAVETRVNNVPEKTPIDEHDTCLREDVKSKEMPCQNLPVSRTEVLKYGGLVQKTKQGSSIEDVQPAISIDVGQSPVPVIDEVGQSDSQEAVAEGAEKQQIQQVQEEHTVLENEISKLPEVAGHPLLDENLPIEHTIVADTQNLSGETPLGEPSLWENSVIHPFQDNANVPFFQPSQANVSVPLAQPIPESLLVQTSTTFPNQFSVSDPYPNVIPSTQPYPNPTYMSQTCLNQIATSHPFLLESFSSRPLASEELHRNLPSREFPCQTSQQPAPPPFPQDVNAPPLSQPPNDNSTSVVVTDAHSQSAPAERLPPNQAPLHYQHSQFPSPSKPSWTSLPQRPLYVNESTPSSVIHTPGFHPLQFQQNSMPPGNDFPLMKTCPHGEPTHPQAVEFYTQTFPPSEEHYQPPFYMEDFRSRPLPMDNMHGQPIGGPNFPRDEPFARSAMTGDYQLHPESSQGSHLYPRPQLREEHHLPLQAHNDVQNFQPLLNRRFISQFPFQGFMASSSFASDNIHSRPVPFPKESSVKQMQSFPNVNLHPRSFSREDFGTTSTWSFALPQQQQSSFGPQQSVADSFPSHLGAPRNVDPSILRYPSSFLENNKPSHLFVVGGSKDSNATHYNPLASPFEKSPRSSKFNSTFRKEIDTNSSRYNSFGLHHDPVGGKAIGGLGSRQIPSPPDFSRSGGQILPRSGVSLQTAPSGELNDHGQSLKPSREGFPSTQPPFVRASVADDRYDPLFDSIEPCSNTFKKFEHVEERCPAIDVINRSITAQATNDSVPMLRLSSSHRVVDTKKNNKQKECADAAAAMTGENEEFGETAMDAEVGAVENWSPGNLIDIGNTAVGDIEIDQVQSKGKSKDSRSMKLFKKILADFVKEVLKPSWRQGNMSKEAFKTIVMKTVDKVSGAVKNHQIPKSRAKINQYVESSERKLTKLVMGYVDKYVKV